MVIPMCNENKKNEVIALSVLGLLGAFFLWYGVEFNSTVAQIFGGLFLGGASTLAMDIAKKRTKK